MYLSTSTVLDPKPDIGLSDVSSVWIQTIVFGHSCFCFQCLCAFELFAIYIGLQIDIFRLQQFSISLLSLHNIRIAYCNSQRPILD